jgi:acetoin utilization protein AcuB
MLSEREINLTYGLETLEPAKLLVIDVCSDDPYIVDPEEPLRLVAQEMANEHHGSAVVIQNDKLVGIFTTVDACRALSYIIEQDIEEANTKYANYSYHSASRHKK